MNMKKKALFGMLPILALSMVPVTLSASAESGTLGGATWEITESGEKLHCVYPDNSSITIENGICFVDGTVFGYKNTISLDEMEQEEWDTVEYLFNWLNDHPVEEIKFSDSIIEIIDSFDTAYFQKATKITFGKNLETIGDHIFAYSNVQELVFPDTLQKIGDSAFDGCADLQSVTLPESLKIVEDGAFLDCDSLTEITILSRDVTFGWCSIGYDFSMNMEPYENFIIRGYKNSTAEAYAAENGITFVALDEPETTEPTTETTPAATEETGTTASTPQNSTDTTPATTGTTSSTTASTTNSASSASASPETGESGMVAVMVSGMAALAGTLMFRKKK